MTEFERYLRRWQGNVRLGGILAFYGRKYNFVKKDSRFKQTTVFTLTRFFHRRLLLLRLVWGTQLNPNRQFYIQPYKELREVKYNPYSL